MNYEGKNTPEDAYRKFMLASLSGDEAAIRPLMVDNDDASILWQGAYPADVAALLSKQYHSMEITRVESPRAEDANRVMLQPSAAPLPIAVVNVNGTWKVDASPIIAFRKAAQESK